jgi:hypothetical protein
MIVNIEYNRVVKSKVRILPKYLVKVPTRIEPNPIIVYKKQIDKEEFPKLIELCSARLLIFMDIKQVSQPQINCSMLAIQNAIQACLVIPLRSMKIE